MNLMGEGTTVSLLLAAGLLSTITTGQLLSQSPAAVRSAGEIFQQRCARCHPLPDPNNSTDRAWLDQVKQTA